MGYRPPNTGYGPKAKAWCRECGDDIPVDKIVTRERCGGRLVTKPLPESEHLCSFCRATLEQESLADTGSHQQQDAL